MNIERKTFIAGTAAAAAVFAFPNVVLGAPEPIRVGLIPPITGANALLGEQHVQGAQLAVEEINKRPGKVFDDRPFEIVTEDATNDNQSAVAALNKILGEGIVALTAPVLSTQIQAMAPVMKSHDIPWMTGGTAVKNTQLGVPGLFRMRASDGITAEAMTTYLVKDLKAKKVAILHASDAFGVGGADGIVESLKKFGMTPAAREMYPKETKDYTSEILKIKQSGADAAAFYVQNPSDVAVILQQVRSLGIKMPIIGSPSMGNQTALETAKPNNNGIYTAVDFIVGFNSNVATHFLTAFYQKFKRLPDVGTGSGWVYDSWYLLADTMKKSKTTDPAKIVDALKATKGWDGVLGTHTCDAQGNMIHSVSVGRIENGKLSLVKKVTA